MRASAPTDLGVGSGSGDCSQAPAFGQGSGVAEGDGAATEAGAGEAGAVHARGRAQAGHQLVEGRGRHLEVVRSEEHTSELQSLMRISYAVFCLQKKKKSDKDNNKHDKTY